MRRNNTIVLTEQIKEQNKNYTKNDTNNTNIETGRNKETVSGRRNTSMRNSTMNRTDAGKERRSKTIERRESRSGRSNTTNGMNSPHKETVSGRTRNATMNGMAAETERNGSTMNEIRKDSNERSFYDEETGTFNVKNLRNGDVLFREPVNLPKYTEQTKEASFTLCRETKHSDEDV